MKKTLILAPLFMLLSSTSFASEISELQRSIRELQKIVTVQQAEINRLKSRIDADGSFRAANGKVVINVQGQWVGDPTGLRGPQGIQGIQGIQGVPGPQGPQGPQGPGAHFVNDIFVIPGEGGVLHLNMQGNECLYKNDGTKRCFH